MYTLHMKQIAKIHVKLEISVGVQIPKKLTLNNLDLSNSKWTLETPLIVWEQATAKFATRTLC